MLKEAMENAQFIGGPNVAGFEKEFADFCGAKYCVGVNSGTDALRFALMAAGIGPGDEVLTVPNTFIATTEAISQVGAIPVFVDIDYKTCNIDPTKVRDFIQDKCAYTQSPSHPVNQSTNQPLSHSTNILINQSTNRPVKAIIPVHLYGQTADLDSLLEIAENYNLIVIEDAAQAHGARYKDREAGSVGLAGCFSFYPGKNLGAFGEGGAVATNDGEMANKIRMIRDHGQAQKYYHDMEGYNGRLDAIQAGVLRIKLKHLAEWNLSRRENAALYDEMLKGVEGLDFAEEASNSISVYHLYVIMVDDRDGLQKYLAEKGIATGLHYPLPLHMQKAYAHLGYKEGDFPIAERSAKRLISLPMFPELTREQIEYVCTNVKAFLNGK
jgi:dTDP-4-amino-4,6-dideoxygalactose transaminase